MSTWKNHLRRAIQIVGSQGKLAKAMGCSQAKVSWLLLTASTLSAEDALAVERATEGRVAKSDLRPDLWPAPKAGKAVA